MLSKRDTLFGKAVDFNGQIFITGPSSEHIPRAVMNLKWKCAESCLFLLFLCVEVIPASSKESKEVFEVNKALNH